MNITKFRHSISWARSLRLSPRARAARWVELGDRSRDARRWETAARAYRKAVDHAPELTGIWVQYGHALKESGDRDAAERAYLRAMEYGLDDADIHVQLGHVRKLNGAKKAAIDCYFEAVKRDPANADALTELARLGLTRSDFRSALTGEAYCVRTAKRETHPPRPTVVFDVSDVVLYAPHFRRPTGIQRVQLNIIGSLIEHPVKSVELMLAAFSYQANYWVEIDPQLFARVSALMQSPGEKEDPEWRRAVGQLTKVLLVADDLDFPPDSLLVNLGSSWAIGNYFLAVRRAKELRGIRYVPFVHDCIPIVAPDYFVPELQRDFRVWLDSILIHGDGYLSNSSATASDLARIASRLGHSAIMPAVIRLDASFGSAAIDQFGISHRSKTSFLEKLQLQPRNFVLFVATIEPRKNHLLAFEAWKALLAKRGASKVPPLVCVGGRGWRNGTALSMLADDATLAEKIVLLHNVSDAELDCLYDACRFTIYPSKYEGWGLPVTESLSKGRVPLIARTSSLPEAGGDWAEYFDLSSPADFRAALERLIDDDDWLAEREAEIKTSFRPRSWRAIADNVIAELLAISKSPSPPARPTPLLPHATFVRLGKDRLGSEPSGVVLGEFYRRGTGWAEPDEGGSPIVSPDPAELVTKLQEDVLVSPDGINLYLNIAAYAVTAADELEQPSPDDGHSHELYVGWGTSIVGRYRIRAGEHRWIVAHIPGPFAGDNLAVSLDVRNAWGSRRKGRALHVMGLYVCGADDTAARQRFVEGVLLGAISEPLPKDTIPGVAAARGLATMTVER